LRRCDTPVVLAQERREKEEAERDARIAAEEAGLVDYRQKEIDLIEAQVADLGYHISKITADGHCLYRSVARQMELIGEPIAATVRVSSAPWRHIPATHTRQLSPRGLFCAGCRATAPRRGGRLLA